MSQIEPICHFCKEPSSNNKRLYFRQMTQVNPHPVIICECCIELLYSSMKKIKHPSTSAPSDFKIPNGDLSFSPKDVFDHLNQSIIGQDEAKKSISVAVFQHYERLKNPKLTHKTNILLVGPTGSGKTEIARSIASFLNVPFTQVDVTTMTPRGYIGESPEVCIEKLFSASGHNVKMAERGIVFLDEFDKIPSGGEFSSFKARAVQQELLRLIEGDQVDIRIGGEHGQKVTIDTSKILFIAAGSFAGLEKYINKDSARSIGLIQETTKPLVTAYDFTNRVKNKHFEEFGLIPEMMGRLPVVCFTTALSKEELCKIITEPKGSILNHYQTLFQGVGAELEVDRECLLDLAEKALADKLGARGLKKQLELKLKDLLFEITSFKDKKILIRKDSVSVVDKKVPTAAEAIA